VTAPGADDGLAASLAEEAGHLLLELRARAVAAGETAGSAGSARLRDEGDRRSHEYLMGALAVHAPDDSVLSEEGPRRHGVAGTGRVWIVDPLDGTREFGEPPRDDWAVHVALAVGGTCTCGAVALPARGLLLSTARPPVLPPAVPRAPRVVVSRTRPSAEALAVAELLGGDVVPMGSAGAKAMSVVLGEADVYVHTGGQYEWDSAAPVAVALAAGLHCSRVDGSPLRYDNEDPYLPDLVICRPELAEAVVGGLATLL